MSFYVSVLHILLGLCLFSFANAQGFLSTLTVNKTTYPGNIPNSTTFASPIRLVNDVSPINGASNLDLGCGKGAEKAQLVVNVDPGSEITFGWASGKDKNVS